MTCELCGGILRDSEHVCSECATKLASRMHPFLCLRCRASGNHEPLLWVHRDKLEQTREHLNVVENAVQGHVVFIRTTCDDCED